MKFFDRLWKKNSKPLPTVLTINDLQVGYLFDYDMKSWQVLRVNNYRYGAGEQSREWEVEHAGQHRFLIRNDGDELSYCWGQKIGNLNQLGATTRQTIIDTDDPPTTITYDGKHYHLEESGTGLFSRQQDEAIEFVYWELIDEQDQEFVTIEQWGEGDFTASHACWIEEYQITNILPSQT